MSIAQSFDRRPVPMQSDTALLAIDPNDFRDRFDRGPFLIGHNLCGHPLFEIERLLQLSRVLPEEKVEYHAGTVPLGLDPAKTPRTGLSAAETIRRIEDCKSWMVLRNAELDAEYRDLLERCLAEVGAHSEPIRPGMRTFEAFVILSSPAAVTPYHIDPEHNFLLQIRGKKRVTVFDRGLVADEQLERFFSGAHRNLPFDGSLDMHGQTFELPPGKGIHIPVTAPHHVVNGPGVSVSFSITFRTPDIGRRQDAFAFNAALRKTGLRPSPVGRSARRDALKSLTMRGWSKSRRVLGLEK